MYVCVFVCLLHTHTHTQFSQAPHLSFLAATDGPFVQQDNIQTTHYTARFGAEVVLIVLGRPE